MNAAPTNLRRYLIALKSFTLVQVIATMGFNQASAIGGTATGWNGVSIAESTSRAPPGWEAEFTGATQLFVLRGALLSPLLFHTVLALINTYKVGYLLLADGVAVCSLSLSRAAPRR